MSMFNEQSRNLALTKKTSATRITSDAKLEVDINSAVLLSAAIDGAENARQHFLFQFTLLLAHLLNTMRRVREYCLTKEMIWRMGSLGVFRRE